jgi:hypothetical protein
MRQSFFDYLNTHAAAPASRFLYLESEVQQALYEVFVKGSTLWRQSVVFNTAGWTLENRKQRRFSPGEPDGENMGIWVMSPEGRIFSGPESFSGGHVHHSAFLAGGRVLGAGEWLVRAGRPLVISNESGHYQPSFTQFQNALRKLGEKGVALKSIAAEWPYSSAYPYWFNAEQIVIPGVRAERYQWPSFQNREYLHPVKPLDPGSTEPFMKQMKDELTRKGLPFAEFRRPPV